MPGWAVWLILVIGLSLAEAGTREFLFAPFAGGALLATFLSAVDAPTVVVWILFVLTSLLLFAVARPIRRSQRRARANLRSRIRPPIGRPAIVVERVANYDAMGSVAIDGEVWTARAFDDATVIEVGEQVEIVEARGATALVRQ